MRAEEFSGYQGFHSTSETQKGHTPMNTISISTLLARNLQDVFGENDPARRRAAIDEIWTEDGVFYDPKTGVHRGRDEIDRVAGAISVTHPDFRYQPIARPEELGNGGRIQWVAGRFGEAPDYAGTDFIIARDGQIAALYLFFDKVRGEENMNELEGKTQTRQQRNKSLVLEAFDTLFNKRDYAAAERYWSPAYIQHSAYIAPGREGLFNLIKGMPPTLKYEAGMIVADGDLVIVHGRFSGFGAPVNWVASDILRIEDEVLVEHWDVIQDEATQEQSKSGRPMFGNSFPVFQGEYS
jgi:predicted SnoaL-like aldol condensation-catalyzing enzyme